MVTRGNLESTPLQEVLQVLAYSRLNGILTVNGPMTAGNVLFDRGGVICAYTASTRSLLAKAAGEDDPRSRLGLNRIATVAALAEMFDLKEGLYHFTKSSEPVVELDGVDLATLYAMGAMDTGDLLLVLAKTMESAQPQPAPPDPEAERLSGQRRHPRVGPTMLKAEMRKEDSGFEGFLTNVSVGGAFFHAEELPQVDQVYDLEFILPRDLGPCRAVAKVVWARVHVAEAKRGVGLSFERIPPESLQRLTIYLDRFQQLAADIDFEA